MLLAEALAPSPSSPSAIIPPSASATHSAPAAAAASTPFVAPNSRRGPRNFKLATFSSSASTADESPSTRDARTEYTPPVPPSALDILSTSPPATRTSTSTSSTSSSSKPAVRSVAPPVPHPHFMFQTTTSYPRRPKTADSQATNASKSSLGRAFGRVFGMTSSSSLKGDVRSPAASTSSFHTAQTTPAPAGEEATKRMNALDLAREKGRRAVQFVKRKLNSKTPVDQLPTTWTEYERAYGNYRIDIEDPPLPPNRIAPEGAEPTPWQKKAYNAPFPPNEVERQNVVKRLDLFGEREKAAMNASQVTLDITARTAGPSSVAMAPSASAASTATSRSSYLAPSEAPSSRRNSSSGFSTHSAATSVISVTAQSPAVDAIQSLQDHPVFRQLVSRAREVFGAKCGAITVLDDDQQLFLASGGMPDGVGGMPRSVSFCSHAILNEDRGLVVLDSSQDWRFTGQMPTAALGARFYAGCPVMARAGPNDPVVPIGTLCVLDTEPREEVSEAHRRVLKDLATQASNAIESWVSERMATKMARLQSSFAPGKPALLPPPCLSPPPLASPPLTPPPSAGFPTPPLIQQRPKTAPGPPGAALPATPPASLHRFGSVSTSSHGHARQDSDVESTASSVPSQVVQPRRPTALSLAVTTDDPVSALPREVQKQFDTAVRMLAKALELELVYLAALDLSFAASSPTDSSSPALNPIRILSAHGLPQPPPSFDPSLHLKALRAPEGGLIYKNPRFSPSTVSTTATYAAGILIPVLEVRRTGYVLCGYTRKEKRDFVQRDLTYFVRFAEGLEAGCIRASKAVAAVPAPSAL
ncbi:hypothetical protein JCM8097_002618 [Rhodosporidiobolus ruineniae]